MEHGHHNTMSVHLTVQFCVVSSRKPSRWSWKKCVKALIRFVIIRCVLFIIGFLTGSD